MAFFVLALATVPAARAQEDTSAVAASNAIEAAVTSVAAEATADGAASVEVSADTEISTADLGATDARVLQDSPLYATKRWWRGLRTAVTFDPVKKAERRMRYANQELADAQQLSEEQGDDAAAFKDVERAMREARGELRAIADEAKELRERKDRAPADVERLLERVANTSLKQQKVFERLEQRAPDNFRERMAEHRDGALDDLGTFMGGVDEPEAMRARFERALDNQEGSDFKHFKNVEVLKELEQRVPEQARDAIRSAQEHAMSRITERISGDPERLERFEAYVERLPGDAVRHYEILDDVRSKADLPQAFVEQMDRIKAKAVEKFSTEFTRAGTEGRERLLGRFGDGDVEALRVAEEFKHFVPPEAKAEIERHEEASIERFKAQFTGKPTATGEAAEAVAEEARRLMRKVRENPEPTDFILLDKLEAKLTPEQRAFVQGLQQEGAEQFERQFRERGEAFLDRFVDPSAPQSLEVLEGLRERGVPGMGIERAIEMQRQRFEEHLNDLENPEVLGRIKDALELDPALKADFEAGDPMFFLKLGEKREELMQRGMEERRAIEDKIRPLFEDPDMPIPDDFDPAMRERIERSRMREAERMMEFDQEQEMEFEREREGARWDDGSQERGEMRDVQPRPFVPEQFRTFIEERGTMSPEERGEERSEKGMGDPAGFGNDFRPSWSGSGGEWSIGPDGKPSLLRPEGEPLPVQEPRYDVRVLLPAGERSERGMEPSVERESVQPERGFLERGEGRDEGARREEFRVSEPVKPFIEMRGDDLPFERRIEGRGDNDRPMDAPLRAPLAPLQPLAPKEDEFRPLPLSPTPDRSGSPEAGSGAQPEVRLEMPLGLLAPFSAIAALLP